MTVPHRQDELRESLAGFVRLVDRATDLDLSAVKRIIGRMRRRLGSPVLPLLSCLVMALSAPAFGDTLVAPPSGTDSGFPVVLNETLFYVHSGLGAFTAGARARAIERRILELSRDARFSPESLRVVENEVTTDITYNDRVILSVAAADSSFLNRTRAAIAQEFQGHFPLL
jgi:hypothetical protein